MSLDVVDESVKKQTLNGVEASEETIRAGDYFLSRPFIMATRGEIANQNEVIQELFTYLKSDAGKKLINSVGLISVDLYRMKSGGVLAIMILPTVINISETSIRAVPEYIRSYGYFARVGKLCESSASL